MDKTPFKHSRTPFPSAGCDIRALPIGPQEAFLFSRIDGSMTEQDLVLITGFDEATVHDVLERLRALGAVWWRDEPGIARDDRPTEPPLAAQPPPSRSAANPTAPPFSGTAPRASQSTAAPRAPATPVPTPSSPGITATYDATELDSPADLDAATKKSILDLFHSLDHLNHYELLGVAPPADRKEIRRSYHARAPMFHPDRFFGKRLGSFKPKMEAVFGRLTLAYETLADAERRAEYDAYLASLRATAAMERLLSTPPDGSPRRVAVPTTPLVPPSARSQTTLRVPTSISIVPDSASNALTMAVRTTPLPSGDPAPRAPRSGPPPSSGTHSTRPLPSSAPPRTAEDERVRREALARKLSGGRATLPPEARASSSPPPFSRRDSQTAMVDLQRLRDAASPEGRRDQIRKHVEAARQHETNGDLAAAANAYRLALVHDPENPALVRAHQEAAQMASAKLADAYVRQGDYEARNGAWPDAARSYTRAAASLPNDPDVQERTARAIWQAGGDLHRAVECAQRAVALAPKRIDARLVLAEIHLAAGRPLLARREIEAAREVAPHDDRIKELSRKLR